LEPFFWFLLSNTVFVFVFLEYCFILVTPGGKWRKMCHLSIALPHSDTCTAPSAAFGSCALRGKTLLYCASQGRDWIWVALGVEWSEEK
jgi:hypothetical protein